MPEPVAKTGAASWARTASRFEPGVPVHGVTAGYFVSRGAGTRPATCVDSGARTPPVPGQMALIAGILGVPWQPA